MFLLSHKSGDPNPSQGDRRWSDWEKLLPTMSPNFLICPKAPTLPLGIVLKRKRKLQAHYAEHVVELCLWLEHRSRR